MAIRIRLTLTALFMALALPALAQLDPRLQGSKTDFLNLYQQSTNTKVKPEVLTIFDFSGSMATLMFHPLFRNNDPSDNDPYRYMGFTLHPAVVAVPGVNTYTIRAQAHGCPNTYATYTITVNSTGAVDVSSLGPNCSSSSVYPIRVRSVGGSGSSKALVTANANVGAGITGQVNTNGTNWTITQSNGTTTTNPITISPTTISAGSPLTFTAYCKTTRTSHDLEWSTDGGTTWTTGTTTTITSGSLYRSVFTFNVPAATAYTITNISTSTTTFTAGTSVTFNASLTQRGSDSVINWSDAPLNHTGTGTSFTWRVPAYDPGVAAADAYVSASLDPTGNTVAGATYLTSSLNNGALVKPDGSLVTAADAGAASTGSGLHGASYGANDVRNWVRAASHVRFVTTVGSDSRSVDIPIPWKITNKDSSGNPLSSWTVLDRETKTAADGTVTNYGSGAQIEMDTNYSFDSGDDVLDGDSSQETYTTLNTVAYRPAYVSWLFNGKYTVGTYTGKYVIFDSANASLSGGQSLVSWGQGYGGAASGSTILVPNYNLNGTYAGTEATAPATDNVIPALSRVQAVKRAAITTWIQFQADVIWGFRFLDTAAENNPTNKTTIDNDTTSTLNVPNTFTTWQRGTDSAWKVLNNTTAQGITSTTGNSVTGMKRIAALFANDGTPLTYAMARGLAQFSDPNSVFNAVETGTDAPSQCMNHFLILFTDGIDNNNTSTPNPNGTTPYFITTSGVSRIDAVAGNRSIIAAKTGIDRNSSWWNLFTFAGVAAHMGDTSLGTSGVDYMPSVDPGLPGAAVKSGVPSSFLPYSLYRRMTTQFTKPHLITTMTVGVSLGGQYSDSTGPKRSLFLAAAVGDPTLSSWADASTLTPFQWNPSLNDGNGGRVAGSLYFYDATNPDKLSNSLVYAIKSAVGASNINTVTNPNTPYVGAALSGEIFIGKFQPPPNGGSVWTGDLLMFGTRLVNDTLQFLDRNGAVTTTIDSSTSQWSALQALYSNRSWKNRHLYTRIPATSNNPTPGLTAFTYTGTAYTDPTNGLQNFVCRASNNPGLATYTAGSTIQQQVIQWAMGGDTTDLDASGIAKTNRPNIMGDIVDSSPAVLEYQYSDVSGSLTSALSGVGGSRFRLVLVGTNQGYLHAFGEVVKQENAVSGNTTTPVITKGAVDELWSFMPTDFLGYLDQLTVTSNPHRFLADGPPVIYHLDLPPASGGPADGIQQVTSSPGPERALVIFGLGKGGRSYYALDIHDPFTPTLKWSLVPGEAMLNDASGASVLGARILARPGAPTVATVQNVVRNMGFSTCTPSVARITLTDSTGLPVVRDAVFFGGGFSVPEVEANFLDVNSKPTPMGRSILALDVYTGQILAAVDLTALTTTDPSGNAMPPGPVVRGLVPFEFILNSGMAQRAYFLDYWGGLWSWGSQKTDTNSVIPTTTTPNPTYKYRIDSSDMAAWTVDGNATSAPGVRLVAKDLSGSAIALTNYTVTQRYYSEALYLTLPAPFRVGEFPGKSFNATGPVPATVGIAIESGDKNNPLDYAYTVAVPKPGHHRLSVVFDRQDSAAWGTYANPITISPTSTAVFNAYPSSVSYQFGDGVITPGNTSYYLAPTPSTGTKFGYYVNFPDIDTSTGLVPKSLNPPLVVSGSLYWSYFSPTAADPCTGGSGYTHSNLICDVLNPIVKDTRTNMACLSNTDKFVPVGVASDFMALGTRGAIQIGTKLVANPQTGASKTALTATTITGKVSNQYPKARVWRTVH